MARSALNTSKSQDRTSSKAEVSLENFETMRQMANSSKVFIAIDQRYVFEVVGKNNVNFDAIGLPVKFLKELMIPVPGSIGFDVLRSTEVPSVSFAELEVKELQAVKIQWRTNELQDLVLKHFDGSIIYDTQTLEIADMGSFEFIVKKVYVGVETPANYGFLKKSERPQLRFFHAAQCPVQILESEYDQRVIEGELSFQRLGIGGMGSQERTFFRKVIASRQISRKSFNEYGVKHLRGILLYGPPGTGKTLIARKLAETLKARPPKIVNGPEVLDKHVGESEKKIRELFADAEEEQKIHGDNSMLHVIVFDEIDALCKVRGSHHDGTGVADNIVNQLLSKLDGVSPLNNVLVIGMTNRIDLIDPAVLRPGRLELHIEVGLPDEAGRVEILDIHTATMRKHHRINDDVNLDAIARRAKNFTGAELAGLVKAAVDFAIERGEQPVRVAAQDFDRALEEVKASHGQDEVVLQCQDLLTSQSRDLQTRLVARIHSFAADRRSTHMAILLTGQEGVGKTTLALNIAKGSEFPCVKVVSPSRLLGLTMEGKIQNILTAFAEARKTPLNCIVLDDLEELIEFVELGERYNPILLQVLKVQLSETHPNSKSVVIATAGSFELLQKLGLDAKFQVKETVQLVRRTEFTQVLGAKGVTCKAQLFSEEELPLRRVLARSVLA